MPLQKARPRGAESARTSPPVAPRLRLPRGRFRPEHCPNRRCPFYQGKPGWRYRREGVYRRKQQPRPLQRFRCRHCQRTFTARTFAATYWLHRDDLFALILQLSVAGSGLRQIARTLGIAHTTVARHLARGGRHCLLFHQHLLQTVTLQEPVAFDGFETFEFSQFFPFHLNLAAGQESWFLYHFTDSPLRRKGRMTAVQRRRREELEAKFGRPDPKAVETGVLDLLRTLRRQVASTREEARGPGSWGSKVLSDPTQGRLVLHSDEHPAYRRALRRLRAAGRGPSILHHLTPSTDPRTRANPLFPANLADLLLRHCGANHRRETIAFSKRRQGALERMAIFLVWRNCIKWRREKKPGETPAMRVGVLSARLGWPQVCRRRLFPRRRELPGVWWSYYWRRVKTVALGPHQREHRLKYAF